MKYIIKDWADNVMFDGKEFDSFEDGWGFIYESIDDDEAYQDLFVLENSEEEQKTVGLRMPR